MPTGWKHWSPRRADAARAAASVSRPVRRRVKSGSMPGKPCSASANWCRSRAKEAPRGAAARQVVERLRRQRTVHRRLSRGHQRPPGGDHRQDEVALQAVRPVQEGAANAASRFRQHGAGGAAARQHAAPSETLKKILAPAERRDRRRAVLYGLQRAAHAAHRAERHGHPRRAGARLRRGRRHRPLLRRLPVPGSRPGHLRAHGPSHLPAASASRAPRRC